MSRQGGDSDPGNSGSEPKTGESDSADRKSADNSPAHAGSSGNGTSTGVWTRVAVVVLGLLLLTAIAGANVASAADRTVLDADHVIGEMEDAGLFAEQTDTFRDEVAGEIAAGMDGVDLPPGISLADFDPDGAAEQSVTEPHVRDEMTGNIHQLFAFLHGDRDDIEFVFDLQPVKEGVSTSVTESATVDTQVLVGEKIYRLYSDRIAALGESEESFEDAQMDLDEREVEAIKADIEADVQARDYTPELTEALIALQFTVVDGLAGELPFDEYVEQLERDEQALKAALGTEAVADMEDSLVLGDEDEDDSEAFAGMADIVQLVSTLALVLPLLAVGLVGAIGAVTRDVRRTAKTAGTALLGAGILGLVIGYAVPELILPEGGEGDLFGDGFLAAVESMFAAIGTQSILLTLGGVLVVGAVIAESRGLFDGLTEETGADSEMEEPAGQTGGDSDQRPDVAADEESDTPPAGE